MDKQSSKLTKLLLLAGVLAGPLYVGLGLLQIAIRTGYDPTRHELSLLSNGELGWVQVANFVVTGLLVILAACGFWRVLCKEGGRRPWVPAMLALYGVGLISAGIFVADPMNGFPAGTPDGAPVNPTINGLMHIISGSLGFVGLIIAHFSMARVFKDWKMPGLRTFSIITGSVFLASFFGIAGGSQLSGTALTVVTLLFTAAVLLSWTWLSVASYTLMKKVK